MGEGEGEGANSSKFSDAFSVALTLYGSMISARCPERRVAHVHPVQVLQARQAHLESFPAS